VEVPHPVPADQRVLARRVERVAHVQLARHVRRRQADRERLAWIRSLRVVEAFLLPGALPAFLDALRAVERIHGAILRAPAAPLSRFIGSQIWTFGIRDATKSRNGAIKHSIVDPR